MIKVRLQVALAKTGRASRRYAAELIKSGRVSVNNKIVTDRAFRVDTAKDEITLDGRLAFFEKKKYYVLNKPAGVLSTARDERGRKTVLDYIKRKNTRLYPVGRLDKDTTGLIILTNDGDLTYRLTHPKFRIDRVYEVKVKNEVRTEAVLRLKKGINLEGKRARAEKVTFKKRSPGSSVLLITLREGQKREVRRMFEAIGYEILELRRIAYGPLRLKGLEVGSSRPLTENEVLDLRRSVRLV